MPDDLSNSNSVNSFENDTDDDNLKDFIPSQADLTLKSKNQNISMEDIAADALTRIFDEHLEIPTTSANDYKKKEYVNFINNQVNLKVSPAKINRQTPISSSSVQTSPKFRHKSILNRYHSPQISTRQGVLDANVSNSIRKTKSTAFPNLNTSWTRGVTASTPDLKVHQGIVTESPLPNDTRRSNRRVYRSRTTAYYSFRLIQDILNCIVLIAGLIQLGGIIALSIYKDMVLVIIKYETYILLQITLATVSAVLLTLSLAALCLVQDGSRRIATQAGCSLIAAAVMVALTSLQTTVENSILAEIEIHMLSNIKSERGAFSVPVWDNFHQTFKCCGVRGYLDWCYEQEISVNETLAEHFLGYYTCKIPESCCMENIQKIEFTVPHKSKQTVSCVWSPTMWNEYPKTAHLQYTKHGCLTPVKLEIYYLAKIYRIICFSSAIILLLSTTNSMILYTYREAMR